MFCGMFRILYRRRSSAQNYIIWLSDCTSDYLVCSACVCVCARAFLAQQLTVHHAPLTLPTLLCVHITACARVPFATPSYDDGLPRLVGAASLILHQSWLNGTVLSIVSVDRERGHRACVCVCVFACPTTYAHKCPRPI